MAAEEEKVDVEVIVVDTQVVIMFDRPVKWLKISKADAIKFGKQLIEKAEA